MVSAGEVFAIAAMFGGATVAIVFIDWIWKNLPDTISEETPWGDQPNVPPEARR